MLFFHTSAAVLLNLGAILNVKAWNSGMGFCTIKSKKELRFNILKLV
jgi:hypothetical protein